jgi:hypothetical protein
VCRALHLAEAWYDARWRRPRPTKGRRDGLTSAEREELSNVRKEIRVLHEERDNKKVAAYFARGTAAYSDVSIAEGLKWAWYKHQVRRIAHSTSTRRRAKAITAGDGFCPLTRVAIKSAAFGRV